VTKESTCNEKGTERHECTVCGASEERELPDFGPHSYGEPVVISCEIVTSAGKLLDGETVVNSFPYVKPGKITEETKAEMEWWNIDKIINAKDRKTDEPMIEVRQGLVDRSKTPFWLVNNADYEAIQ